MFAYLDDQLVANTLMGEHEQHIELIFGCFECFRLIVNPTKCISGVPEVDFLSHPVTAAGVAPLEDKVQAVRDFSQPTSLRKLREFLGLLNFHRRFISDCARILQLLRTKENPNSAVDWTVRAAFAFSTA